MEKQIQELSKEEYKNKRFTIGIILISIAGGTLFATSLAMATEIYMDWLTPFNAPDIFIFSFIIAVIGGIMLRW